MLQGTEYFYPYFRESILDMAKLGRVINLGASQRFQKQMRPFESCFNDTVRCLDINGDPDIKASIYDIPLDDNSIDGVICISVFEHLANPFKAADELHRILKPGGRAFVVLPFMRAEHGKPGKFGDYFRFTGEGVGELFKMFASIAMQPRGGSVYYRISMFPKLLKLVNNRACMPLIKALDGRFRQKTTVGWMVNLVK
ncbi:class I SAM-dependent methyltransferase [Thermodesulfobacteriota bacterium]